MRTRINKDQIRAMQTLRHKVFGTDEEYREWLANNFGGKRSTKDLSYAEAREGISLLAGNKPQDGPWLSCKQAWLIDKMENELCWQDNPQRMVGFIRRQTGLNKTKEMLTVREASKVITGLKKLIKETENGLSTGN